jgi:hypothetical protein
MHEWFGANLLSLNYDKTQYVPVTTKGTFFHDSIIGYNNKFISISTITMFLGMIIENMLSWKAHIDQLIPKLCTACYAIRTVKPFMCQENLKSVYYSYFHSLITYGIIFWGNSSHSIHVFRLQMRVIRIITGSRPRDSCKQLFKKLGTLPLISQYILSLLLFIVKNKALSELNSDVHNINTRYKPNLHRPIVNLTYKKGTYYVSIKIFNSLPTDIKDLSRNVNQFRLALRDFLHLNSFYILEEYFNSSNNSLPCL